MRKDIRMPKKSRLGKGVGALFPTLPTLDEENELEARESVNVSRETSQISSGKNVGKRRKTTKTGNSRFSDDSSSVPAESSLTSKKRGINKKQKNYIPSLADSIHPSDFFFDSTGILDLNKKTRNHLHKKDEVNHSNDSKPKKTSFAQSSSSGEEDSSSNNQENDSTSEGSSSVNAMASPHTPDASSQMAYSEDMNLDESSSESTDSSKSSSIPPKNEERGTAVVGAKNNQRQKEGQRSTPEEEGGSEKINSSLPNSSDVIEGNDLTGLNSVQVAPAGVNSSTIRQQETSQTDNESAGIQEMTNESGGIVDSNGAVKESHGLTGSVGSGSSSDLVESANPSPATLAEQMTDESAHKPETQQVVGEKSHLEVNVSRETIPDQSPSEQQSSEKQDEASDKNPAAIEQPEDIGIVKNKKNSQAVESSQNAESGEGEEPDLVPVEGGYLAEIAIDDISPNEKQPRSVFAEEELQELADSIKEVGVLQPVVVRKRDDFATPYELIMGERRLRASKLAGLDKIPAIVRTTADDSMLRDALLENLHRVALNPLEEAAAYQQMMEDFGLTQEQLSQSISKSRPQIANTLRLLQLPGSIQKKVASGVLSAGHARALLALPSAEQMESLAKRVVAEGLSVRSTEEIVALQLGNKKNQRKRKPANIWSGSPEITELSDFFETKVDIKGSGKKGKIEITFTSADDLHRIINLVKCYGHTNDGKDDNTDGWF